MPLDISALSEDVATIQVSYASEVGSVAYRPMRLTVAWSNDILEAAKNEDQYEMVRLIVEVLESWDFVDNGKPLEISEETVLELPSALFGAITQALMEDSQRLGRVVRPSRDKDITLSKFFGNLLQER